MKTIALLLSVVLSVSASNFETAKRLRNFHALKQENITADEACAEADDYDQCVIDWELAQSLADDVVEFCDEETGEGC